MDRNPTGTAEAFQYRANGSGTVITLSIFVDSGRTATQIVMGLYTNTGTTTATFNPPSIR